MLAKFEIGIARRVVREPILATTQIDAVHEQLASVPSVGALPRPLAELAPLLARAYLKASMAHEYTGVRAPWWVYAGVPVMLVMYSAEDQLVLPAKLKTVLLSRDHHSVELGHWWQPFRGKLRRVWFLGYEQANYAIARQLRIDLVRLHCEHESLRIILRHIARGVLLPEPRSALSDRLQRYLNEAITTVTKLRSARRNVICETSCRLVEAAAAEVLEDDTASLATDLELQLTKLDARPNIRRKVSKYAVEEDRPESYREHALVAANHGAASDLVTASDPAPEPHATAAVFNPSRRRNVILFLAVNPDGISRLRLDEECAGIELEFSMTAARDDFEFRSKWAVTVDELMRHLLTLSPTIIHFSGHGRSGANGDDPVVYGRDQQYSSQRDVTIAARAGIYLQNENRQPHCVDGDALAQMIASTAPSVRVVVLNACFSDALAESLCRIVDCVVGMRGAVDDDAARSFSVAFYRALGNRSSVTKAVEQAVATLAAKQFPGKHLPVCRTREGINADQLILLNDVAHDAHAFVTRTPSSPVANVDI